MFTRTQWAVGQGFFHSGEVRGARKTVRYVYDCGSLDPASLDREIAVFLRRHKTVKIDLLYVSHYHYDHVSGLEKLLTSCDVGTVIIPLIEPLERLAALGASIPANAVSSWAVNFAADPRTALRDIAPNAEVIEVAPVTRDGDDFDDDPTDDGAIDVIATGIGGSEALADPTGVQLRTGRTSSLEGVDTNGNAVVLWQWKSYATQLAWNRRAKLKAHLAAQKGLSDQLIEAAMKTPAAFRAFVAKYHTEISNAFAASFPDVNLSSLLLYSGPPADRPHMGRTFRRRSDHVDGREIGAWGVLPGWLGTGDQKMGKRRCKEVAREYGETMWRVGVLALPHHGAKSSYTPGLLEMFPGQKPTCVVSAGVGNQYDHPSNTVLMDVASQGGSVVLVTGTPASRSTEAGSHYF
ncbi:MBL fold metallo-hydrolase [Plantibacter sp. CFBP 8775]|nr:MBL fold metallo-hydrolase [Plantibacter sp. CFBP 8775]